MRTTLLFSLACLGPAALAADKEEWAKDVPITTKWESAIKAARNTGKILFIYNGWKGRKI